MTVAQLEREMHPDEWEYWIAFERRYGLRDERHHDARKESWWQSHLLRRLLFDISSAVVKWKDKKQAEKAYFPEDLS